MRSSVHRLIGVRSRRSSGRQRALLGRAILPQSPEQALDTTRDEDRNKRANPGRRRELVQTIVVKTDEILEGYVELGGEAVEIPTYFPCLQRCPFNHGFPHFLLTALQPDVARRPSS